MNSIFDIIIHKYEDVITGPRDLTGGDSPSTLFYILAPMLRYLLEDEPEKCISSKGIRIRRHIHPIIARLGAAFLKNPQVMEPHRRGPLPDEPVIWVANHGFKDDILATVLAAKRHAYILLASLPQFYNTFDGVTAWLNGVILANRKVKSSRHAVVNKAVRVLELGADLIIFPEGVWNKSPNALVLNLWPGVYRIACKTGAKIVPVIHYPESYYLPGKEYRIHTIVGEAFRIDHMSQEEALSQIRNTLATGHFQLMEMYGCGARSMLVGSDSNTVREEELKKRVRTASRYDREIELSADYRPKEIIRAEDVWRPVARIAHPTKSNLIHIIRAKELLETERMNDFQKRF